ncbi:AbiH family protein [Thalassobellus sediminis]|uniref:AbiH family protein n=1 Tax=Thalassobellus sediminis TaxID=3367753 RepID=UPI0037B9514C
MNIVYIIGNGFDINLEIPTKYSEFYKYYIDVKSSNSLISNLKKDIEIDVNSWSDLELRFGKYCQHLKSYDEFKIIYNDIQDKLGDYLEKAEKDFDFKQINKDKIYNYLAFPEENLTRADYIKIKAYRKIWNTSQWNINIITLNYTHSIENILNYTNQPIQIQKKIGRNFPVVINRIEHLHGFFDERMILGVNDISQIKNEKFKANQKIRQTLIKSECNQAQRHTIDDWCLNRISDANLICVFGSSIGESDTYIWEKIGNKLLNGCFLIIFYYEKDYVISKRRPQEVNIIEDEKKMDFIHKSNLTQTEIDKFKEQIFFSINNTQMFNFK